MAAVPEEVTPPAWSDCNRECLGRELERLRLIMKRRACWLRRRWREDALAAHRGLVISDARADQLLAPVDESAERAFRRENPLSREIDAELAALERALAAERRNFASGGVAALTALADQFSLGDFERDLVLLCFAVADDPGFATLCAYLQDDTGATRVTFNLALDLLCDDEAQRASACRSLGPDSPLRRFRLLHLSAEDGSASSRVIWVDERISNFVRGINRPDGRVTQHLRVVPRSPIGESHEQIVAGLMRLAADPSGLPPPLINLTGTPRSGRRAVAAEFAARMNVQLLALDAKAIPPNDAERQELARLMEREAVLSQWAYYLDVSELDAGERSSLNAVQDWIERFAGVLFVGGRERWRFSRAAVHVAVTRPSPVEQRALWSTALKCMAPDPGGEIDQLVQQFDFGPEDIPQVVRGALVHQRSHQRASSFTADLWQASRAFTGAHLGALAERMKTGYDWDDIVLPDDVMQQVRELANQVASRALVYEHWGFGSRLPRGRGIAALFCGPSGTGKTMTAEILARHLNLDLYRIDLAGVVSKYIGETEKNLRSIFDAAEQSGAILFFDEADALFGKRTEVRDSHDRYANIEVNYLLQRMEDYRGLAILCTNRRSSLDRAFLRRLRFLIEFPFPDAEHRRRIWQKMIPPTAPLGPLDFAKLARLEVPGGNIRNIAINAAFLAASAQQSISDVHVLQAAKREYAKIDKLLTHTEFGAHYRQERGDSRDSRASRHRD